MSGTPLKKSEKKDKILSGRKRPGIPYAAKSIREERPKLTEKQRKEHRKCLGNRTEPRDISGWDTHTLGKNGIPACDMRYRVFEEMRSRGYKGRNAVAKMFGVSGAFVTKWTQILRAAYETGAGVMNACRALASRPPGSVRSPAADRVKDAVLAARARFPFLGPKKIRIMFCLKVSASTVGRIIKKFRLQRKHKPYKRHKYVRFERPFPMYCLQTDYKQWAEGVYSIWVLDDHSRKILGHRVVPHATAGTAIEVMDEVVSACGLPIQVLTDHGIQFTTMHEDGEHSFESWLSLNKINHIMGRVKHPQTQGKVERSHGSAKAEMAAVWGGEPETLEEYRGAIAAWIGFHNNDRVHESLDYKTPAEVFARDRIGTGDPAWLEAVLKEFPDGARVC